MHTYLIQMDKETISTPGKAPSFNVSFQRLTSSLTRPSPPQDSNGSISTPQKAPSFNMSFQRLTSSMSTSMRAMKTLYKAPSDAAQVRLKKQRVPSFSAELIAKASTLNDKARHTTMRHTELRQCCDVWDRYHAGVHDTMSELTLHHILKMLAEVGVYLPPASLAEVHHKVEVEHIGFGLLDFLTLINENSADFVEYASDEDNQLNAFVSVKAMMDKDAPLCTSTLRELIRDSFGVDTSDLGDPSDLTSELSYDRFVKMGLQRTGMDCILELLDVGKTYGGCLPMGVAVAICVRCGMRREALRLPFFQSCVNPNGTVDAEQLAMRLMQVEEENTTLEAMAMYDKQRPVTVAPKLLVTKARAIPMNAILRAQSIRSGGSPMSLKKSMGNMVSLSKVGMLVAKFGHILKSPVVPDRRDSYKSPPSSPLLRTSKNTSFGSPVEPIPPAPPKNIDSRRRSTRALPVTSPSPKDFVEAGVPTLELPSTPNQFRARVVNTKTAVLANKGSRTERGSVASQATVTSRRDSVVFDGFQFHRHAPSKTEGSFQSPKRNTAFQPSLEDKIGHSKYSSDGEPRGLYDHKLHEFYHNVPSQPVQAKKPEGKPSKNLGLLQFVHNTGPTLSANKTLEGQRAMPPTPPEAWLDRRPSSTQRQIHMLQHRRVTLSSPGAFEDMSQVGNVVARLGLKVVKM